MKDLISVIIPVYNVEEYLNECLESVINQTYKKLEIILIDDGSMDSSGAICDEYAKKDKRIIVIHKENGGVSKARNVALDIAKGNYITFLDSDDYMFETGIELLYNICTKNEADISIAGVQNIVNDKKDRKSVEIESIFDKEEALKTFFEEKYFQCVIWSKMYKREIIGNERFDENVNIAEDFDFLYRVLKKVDKVAINNNELVYYYRIRNGSLMRQKYNKKFENEINLTEKVLEDVKINFPKIEDSAIRRYQRIVISCINKYFKENNEIDGVSHLLEHLDKYPLKIELCLRIQLFLLLHNRKLLRFIYIKIGKI